MLIVVWKQVIWKRHSRTLKIPNFCLDRPFAFSVYRDTLFCPSRLFRFSTCQVYIFLYISLTFSRTSLVRQDALIFVKVGRPSGSRSCVVFFDYVCVHRVWEVFAIHGAKYHNSAGKYYLDYKWSLIGGIPFAPGITLWKNDALDY